MGYVIVYSLSGQLSATSQPDSKEPALKHQCRQILRSAMLSLTGKVISKNDAACLDGGMRGRIEARHTSTIDDGLQSAGSSAPELRVPILPVRGRIKFHLRSKARRTVKRPRVLSHTISLFFSDTRLVSSFDQRSAVLL